MDKFLVSVILCTRNPKAKYITRVFESLKSQILSKKMWELIIIDNASDQPIASVLDISWHPSGRHVREERMGIIWARIRGIEESQGEIIVFVDDDNLLFEDYLEQVLKISSNFPMLGAWGGQLIPEFESVPPDWTKPYWEKLAIRQFDEARWSNIPFNWESTPVTAGGCYRRSVALAYLNLFRQDPRRSTPTCNLEENRLFWPNRCEDLDLAYASHDLGLGTGLFPQLKLIHIMPSRRFDKQYLLKLTEGGAYSLVMLKFIRGKYIVKSTFKLRLKLLLPLWLNLRFLLIREPERSFTFASAKGERLATNDILAIQESVS